MSRFFWWLYQAWTANGRAYHGLFQWWIADVLNRLAWHFGPAPWWNDDARRIYAEERQRMRGQ